MAGGLLVGPAMGFVGALVRARVTTKLCPSHPLVDRRSECLVSSATWNSRLEEVGQPTISTPSFIFIFDDYLP
jgi:hypothetical protein